MNSALFERSVSACYSVMYATANSVLRDSELAADAVQDALESLWSARGRLGSVDNVASYCCKVARNKAIDMLRRRDADIVSRLPEGFEAASEIGTPGMTVELADTRRRMAGIIRRLPDGQRRVVVLSAYRSLSNSEIATVTGMSENNVRVLLSRARRTIKEMYSD